MRHKLVRVFAPATVSNLGSAFDVVGFALDRPGDLAVARTTKKPGLAFSVKKNKSRTPSSVHSNVAGHVALLLIEECKPPFGIDLTLHKLMPVGSGLGSSAASSVASVVAVNALLPKPLKRADLLRFAVEGERMASGAPHADNVAPSLLGGVCLIRSYDPLDAIRIPAKNTFLWVVVHPRLVVKTAEARAVLPKTVKLSDAVRQWGNVAGLIAGLMTGDAPLVGKCVEDVVVEPVRARLIPGFYAVKRAALEAGAFGCSISGSGPSLFALASSPRQALRIGSAMRKAFRTEARVACDVIISRINADGAKVLLKKSL